MHLSLTAATILASAIGTQAGGFASTCGDITVAPIGGGPTNVIAKCRDNNANIVSNVFNLSGCLGIEDGNLVCRPNGMAVTICSSCSLPFAGTTIMACNCVADNGQLHFTEYDLIYSCLDNNNGQIGCT